jgi:hypothetical protein
MRRLVLIVTLVLAACTSEPSPDWRKVTLPVPAGSTPALGDLVRCGDRLYAVGAVRTGATRRPAAWTSTDGTAWSAVPVEPASVYGPTSLLYAAGCRGDDLAALGSAIGGAHGNPRTGTWILTQNVLKENLAEFELFGGPRALSVNRIAGGASGWLVIGNRTDGAAAWPSADGRTFTLTQVDGDGTQAFDVAATSDGWVAVGARRDGSRLLPAVWRSVDGRSWRVQDSPVARGVLQRVDGDVAAGTSDDGFVLWFRQDDRVEEFGSVADDAPGVPAVRSLAVDGENILVAASDGARLRLWTPDGTEMDSPVELAANGTNRLAVALRRGTAILATDDGTNGTVWIAPLSS